MFDYENRFCDLLWKETIGGIEMYIKDTNIYKVWNNEEFYKLQEA